MKKNGVFFFFKGVNSDHTSQVLGLVTLGDCACMSFTMYVYDECVRVCANSLMMRNCLCACIQTVKVSGVEKLTRYIDGSQLTSDFGGFLPYDHNQWLSLRQVGVVLLSW